MHILILTQVYWPDTASTAQHLSDLAETLAERGHQVQVIASRYTYEKGERIARKTESHRGVSIRRIWQTSFSKSSTTGRLLNFFSFNTLLAFHLGRLKPGQFDLILGMTSPPLISFLGVLAARWKKTEFAYWTMDLQPELAIQSGMIRQGSLPARLLTRLGDYVFQRADKIIALDRFMQQHIEKRGAHANTTEIVPVWPVLNQVYDGPRLANPFRQEHGFGERIVVMYSGNHSFVHPLDTLLDAALQLGDDPRFLFVFIGEGVRKRDVTHFQQAHQLKNILQLPYQPRERIHLSLGSADLQVVILGKGQVGYTHPNKIYGAMFIGKPILYIGPKESHVSDILAHCPGNLSVRHGEVKSLVRRLCAFADLGEAHRQQLGQRNQDYAQQHFHPQRLKDKMAGLISRKASPPPT